MSAENKALVRRYVEEVLNKGNLALIEELFAPTFVDHDSSMPEARGPAGVKQLAAMVRASFPDLHFTIEDSVGARRQGAGSVAAIIFRLESGFVEGKRRGGG